ncbi:MAG TPA: SDR family oxidoreductase [Bacteriovoracaceae bacterium]|nr:SDR family oxidoreductase [Bacteriovoracaceae bacterium]
MNVVITGTSRGIGLELTRHALIKGHKVLAIARKPQDSHELMQLKNESKNLILLQLDLDVENAEQKIAQAVKDWSCVDVLINNAGIYSDDKSRKDFELSFLTNSIMPLFVTRALLPMLKKSSRPVSLQITSQMGSIQDNTSGGSYSYRASKSALNMFFKCLSIDETWLISLLVHPGWVKTRMGGNGAPLSAVDSSAGIWKLIENADAGQNGSFLNYRGEKIPW